MEPSSHEPGDGSTPPIALDYEVLRLIGRGGYGEVWLVRDRADRYLACKIIYRESFDNDRPYEREYEGIKKFEPVSRASDSQVNILHVGRRDEAGYFYYIMELGDDAFTGQTVNPDEYVPKTLASELKLRDQLPAGECIRLGLSLSAALENLHEHGLIHRDVKPSNIIFVNGIPKLADIGLVSDRDVTVSYVGTEGFIPPEGPGSVQADVYGLGKVLYEMSTGKDRLEYPELPDDLGTASQRDALLELNAAVIKACEHDVRKRYQTVGELHADLTLLSSGKSLRQRRKAAMRRRIFARALLAIVLVSLITAGAIAGYRKLNSPPSPPAVAPTHDKLAGDSATERTPEADRQLAQVCLRTGFEALGQDDYPRARELAQTARLAANAAQKPYLPDEAAFLEVEVLRCATAYQAVEPSIAVLKEKPDDAKVNLTVGKFRCLSKNDWDIGLPMLARSDDEAIHVAAEKELDHDTEANIADAWWAVSLTAVGDDQTGFQRHAKVWYLKAIAQARLLDKADLAEQFADKLKQVPSPAAQVHIHSRVGNAQRIDFYPEEVRWKSDGLSLDDRINQFIIGDLHGKLTRVIKNTGATRFYPEGVDFSTAQLKIDHKAKRRGDAKLEVFEDHLRVTLSDKPAGTSEIEVTITFTATP